MCVCVCVFAPWPVCVCVCAFVGVCVGVWCVACACVGVQFGTVLFGSRVSVSVVCVSFAVSGVRTGLSEDLMALGSTSRQFAAASHSTIYSAASSSDYS